MQHRRRRANGRGRSETDPYDRWRWGLRGRRAGLRRRPVPFDRGRKTGASGTPGGSWGGRGFGVDWRRLPGRRAGRGPAPTKDRTGARRGGGDFWATGCMGGLWGMGSRGFRAGEHWLAGASVAATAGVRLFAGGRVCGDDLYARWRVSVWVRRGRRDALERRRSGGREGVGRPAGALPARGVGCVCGDAGSRAWGDCFGGRAVARRRRY